MLVGDIPGRQDTALKLLHPLLQQVYSYSTTSPPSRMCDRVLRFCFHLLEEDSDTMGEDQVRSRNLALLVHIIVRHPDWDPRRSFTAAQFDLLMDYHLHICEGTDYDLIKATFRILELGSSNNPERIRRHIDTIIRFMGVEITCISALRAALTIREIASITRHDGSLREHFSKALASAALLGPTDTWLTENRFKSYLVQYRNTAYLQLLCVLAQDPTWYLQLHQNGHFDNCLAIVKTQLTRNSIVSRGYAAPVAHICAIIDALGDETLPLFNTVRAYPRWPLVLEAWKYIFNTPFFRQPTEDNWITVSREDYLDSLPSLIAYARKQSNDNEEPLIVLVEQVCRKLDERKQRREQGDAPPRT